MVRLLWSSSRRLATYKLERLKGKVERRLPKSQAVEGMLSIGLLSSKFLMEMMVTAWEDSSQQVGVSLAGCPTALVRLLWDSHRVIAAKEQVIWVNCLSGMGWCKTRQPNSWGIYRALQCCKITWDQSMCLRGKSEMKASWSLSGGGWLVRSLKLSSRVSKGPHDNSKPPNSQVVQRTLSSSAIETAW